MDRLVRIFEAVTGGPASLSKVAAQAGLSDATTLRYLGSLVSHGLLDRDPVSRQYQIGMRMFLLGRGAVSGRDFMSMVTSSMARLVEQFNETVNFGARVGHDLVIVHALESSQPIRMGAAVGDKDAWHASGLGKAIMSTLPDADVRALLASNGMPGLTPRTHTDPDDLLRELARVRERGFAIDDEETVEGLRCAAAPIRDAAGAARYALSVSGPAYRLSHARLLDIGGILRGQAEVLEALAADAPADTGR
ncbi:MAG: IclR family transcriptional regulator [Micromonosporaceae bacterium]|nr:IclR family transcriptional regulator [Micromonosporaceae bacterium]